MENNLSYNDKLRMIRNCPNVKICNGEYICSKDNISCISDTILTTSHEHNIADIKVRDCSIFIY